MQFLLSMRVLKNLISKENSLNRFSRKGKILNIKQFKLLGPQLWYVEMLTLFKKSLKLCSSLPHQTSWKWWGDDSNCSSLWASICLENLMILLARNDLALVCMYNTFTREVEFKWAFCLPKRKKRLTACLGRNFYHSLDR